MTIEEARALWQPEGIYLNTASYGLPPRPAWDALQAALADWRTGRTSWEAWCDATEGARTRFGRLVGVPARSPQIGPPRAAPRGVTAGSRCRPRRRPPASTSPRRGSPGSAPRRRS